MVTSNCKRNIPVIFDDTYNFIEVAEKDYKCLHSYEYSDCLHILLTEKQLEQYYGDCTKREFMTTETLLNKFIEYITNNYWRK